MGSEGADPEDGAAAEGLESDGFRSDGLESDGWEGGAVAGVAEGGAGADGMPPEGGAGTLGNGIEGGVAAWRWGAQPPMPSDIDIPTTADRIDTIRMLLRGVLAIAMPAGAGARPGSILIKPLMPFRFSWPACWRAGPPS